MTDYNTLDDVSATVQAAPKTIHIDRNDWDNTPTAYPDDDTGKQQIADDIKRARLNITKLPVDDRRELDDDTFQYFGFGYLETWRHPKMPNMKPTPRIIARLGSGDDTPSYNAILTNTGRKLAKPVIENSDDPPKWTEKSLSAGKKLVFNPRDLTKSIVIISEGEIDCASLWQACQRGKKIDAGNDATNIGLVALGGAGQCTDIINRLSKMVIKPRVLILFDGDKPGRNRAEEFRQKLWAIGVVAVAEFFDDTMSDDEKKPYGGKIDANAILQREGTDALYRKFARVFKQARDNFKSAEIALKAWQEYQQSTQADKMKSAGADSKRERSPEIQDLINRINREVTAEQLVGAGVLVKSKGNFYCCPWCGSGHGSHGTGALKVYPGNGVACHQCNKGGSVLTLVAHVRNATTTGKEFFEFLRSVADDFGVTYDPKIFEPPKYKTPTDNDFKTGDATVDEWQRQFGVIDKQVYLEICAAKNFLTELTTETLTAAVARSKSTLYKVALCSYYDFALDAADKFFATLDDAKSRATAQVADTKANKVDVPAYVRMMTTVSVSEIRKSLAPLVTEIRKAHKKFVAEFNAKSEAATVKTLQEKLKHNAPTTRQKIEDCPVDLVVPPTVYFGEMECGIQNILPNGTLVTRPGALAPVTITKKFCDGDGNTEYEVVIKTGGKWHKHCVDGRTLQSARGVEVLGGYGLPIEDTGALSKYFARLVAANDATLPVTKVFTQTGWTDDDFKEFAYPSQDVDYRIRRAGFDFEREFACRGDADLWKKNFQSAMSASGTKARVFVGTALAAPLVRLFNIPNLQTHLYGDSGCGKTAVEKIAASIYGNPLLLIRTFEATAKNKQAVAAAHNDLPTFLDELGTVNGKKGEDALGQSVYGFSLGNQNQAQFRNGDSRPLVKFYGARLSTGERAILKNHDARGNFKRLLQLQCGKLFDDSMAADLHIVAEKNFGHFGHKWIDYVTTHVAQICASYDTYARVFTKGQRNYEPTLIKAVVAAVVAYQHFMICIGAQDEFDDSACPDDVQTIIDDLPTLEEISDDTRALRDLRSFVAAHQQNFIGEAKDGDGESHEVNLWTAPTYGKHFDDGKIAFLPTELQKILEHELGFSSKDALVDAWYRKGLLVTNTGRRDLQIRLNKTRPRTVCFKPGIISEGYDSTKKYTPSSISYAYGGDD